jgi:hypothetical protein
VTSIQADDIRRGPAAVPDRRNLVLGIAWGLESEEFLRFSKSLRQVAPAADVVLLAKDMSSQDQHRADQEGIQLVPLISCYYGLCKSSGKRARKESLKRIRNYIGIRLLRWLSMAAYPLVRIGYTREECRELRRELGKLVIHTYSSRFVQYRDLLRNLSVQYEKVMLTDVRDVFFQADPFARIPSDQLWMFQEQGPATLGTEPRNRRWVEATFGRKVLRQIASQPILCAGITIGGFQNVVGYLEAMEPEFLKRTPVYIPDQGIHNAMAYTGALNHLNPKIIKNGDGPVLHVGMMTEGQLRFDGRGRLVDAAGNPYAVIHQYDRHPKLIALLQSRLAANGAPRPVTS